MSHNQSKYFEFKSELVNNNFSLSEFKGWNGLIIMKLDCPKDLNIKNDLINSKYIDISEKEKIIVAIKGEVEVKLNHQSFVLKEFDSLNLYSSDSKFEIKSILDSQIFIISAEDLKPQKKIRYFLIL